MMWTALAIRLFAVINRAVSVTLQAVKLGPLYQMMIDLYIIRADGQAKSVLGFPITQTQVAVLGSAGVRERSPTPTLMLYGMPESPHQVAVLSPRPRSVKEMDPSSLTTGLAPPPATPRSSTNLL